VAHHWDQLGATDMPPLQIRPGWAVASAATVLATYFLLILAWRFVLSGWGQRMPLRAAVKVWCVSNLGRYVPGKVWAVAGMAVMAKAHGVDGWAATASALVMQVIALATAVVVVLATIPALQIGGADISAATLVAAGVFGLGFVWLLTVPAVMTALGRLTGGRFSPRPLTLQAVAAGTGSALLSWFAYGLALWFLARSVIPDAPLALSAAVGSFAAAYMLGLLAIFAPGGLVVREGVLFGLLAPLVGAGAALILVPASRLLLTATEVVAAGAALGISSSVSNEPTNLE
jgi:hypothetical protein